MPTLEYDLHYIQSVIDNLENYLLSKDIYWPIRIAAKRGAPPYPQLTLGNLLLARLRAEARASSGRERSELRNLDLKIEAIKHRWRVAWENKARDEFRARLRLWANYVDDYRIDPNLNYSRYSYEVGRRVLLQLLGLEAHKLPDTQLSLLNELDMLVRVFFIPGEFIWAPELAGSLPEGTYWYLYGHLKDVLISSTH